MAVQHARLLLVGQDAASTDPARARLTIAGYEVETVPEAESAIASAHAALPELAVLISPLPDALGRDTCFALAQSLKSIADGAYLPVIVVASPEADDGHGDKDVDDVLLLPLVPEALLRRVGALLHLKRLYQAQVDSAQESAETCAEAQAASARFQAVFSHAPVPLLLVDANEARILQANLCALTLTHYTEEQMAGLPLASLASPEDAWAVQVTAQGGLLGYEQPDAMLLASGGERIPVAVQSVLAQDSASTLVVTLRDRRDELAQLDAAQQAAGTDMANAFSREINNPLFVISSNAELLQTALLDQDSSLQTKLGRIADASRRIALATGRLSSPSSE